VPGSKLIDVSRIPASSELATALRLDEGTEVLQIERLRLTQVAAGLLVRLAEPGLPPEVHGQVGQGEALVDAHRLDRLAAPLDRQVVRAFGPEPADHLQGQVLGVDAGMQPAVQVDPDRLRNTKPGLAGGEGHGDVGRPEPRREAAERAVRGAVRVSPDHDATRPDESLLHHQLVADALLEDVGHAELVGEIAHDLVEAGRRHRVRRQDVGEDHDHALRIPERDLELAKGLDRERARDVVGHRIVNRGDDDLAGVNRPAQTTGEDLFGQRTHACVLLRPGPSPGAGCRVRHC